MNLLYFSNLSNRACGLQQTATDLAVNKRPRWIMLLAVILLTSLAVLLVADQLLDPQKFQIKKIEVHGRFHQVDGAQVKQSAEAALKGNYFSVNLRRIENKIKQIPWVFSASLRRQWPSTIVVDVVEVQPVARWGEDKWLNFTGDLVDRQPGGENKSSGDLPLLHGSADQEQIVWKAFQQWSERFASNGLTLEQLSLDSRDLWWLKLSLGALASSRGQSTQGSGEVIDRPDKVTMVVDKVNSFPRIERFIDALNQELIDQFPQMKTIDLRYPNGFAISWQGSQSVAQNITESGFTSQP